jgi:hypothetical protein
MGRRAAEMSGSKRTGACKWLGGTCKWLWGALRQRGQQDGNSVLAQSHQGLRLHPLGVGCSSDRSQGCHAREHLVTVTQS